jgi:hypothetical protein
MHHTMHHAPRTTHHAPRTTHHAPRTTPDARRTMHNARCTMQRTCRRKEALPTLARNLLHLGRSPLRVRHLAVDLHLPVQLLRPARVPLLRRQLPGAQEELWLGFGLGLGLGLGCSRSAHGAHLPRLAQSELRAHGAYLHARESLDGSRVVGWSPARSWLLETHHQG